jgi:rubredoxin
MYACLACGFVHDGILKTRHYNDPATRGCGPFGGSRKADSGIERYRECPKCKSIKVIERISNKN